MLSAYEEFAALEDDSIVRRDDMKMLDLMEENAELKRYANELRGVLLIVAGLLMNSRERNPAAQKLLLPFLENKPPFLDPAP